MSNTLRTGEERTMTATTPFPTTGVELRYLLVASDYARSLAFYRDVLGATLVRQISDRALSPALEAANFC